MKKSDNNNNNVLGLYIMYLKRQLKRTTVNNDNYRDTENTIK